MNKIYFAFVGLVCYTIGIAQPVYQSPAFSIQKDKVVQGKYEATALSPTHIVSNYQSPANLFQSATIEFKFAINGRDNEMLMGMNHQFTVVTTEGKASTPIIKFGEQLKQASADTKYLQPNSELTIKLDFREVLKQFKENGFYTSVNGDKIYKEDFKGVFIAGGTSPLSWDFDNLLTRKEKELKDEDGDGIYEIKLVLNRQSDEQKTDAEWTLQKDISPYPQYSSGYPIADALYNMSLEEMLKAIEKDSTFRTGKEWGGVWTRDISYSIILSMAHLQPLVAKYSLLRKVNKKKKIVQDTGTGGAWPVSTDRMIWAVAAWEIFVATGDKNWLQQAYEIVLNSVNDDELNAYDKATGLVRGESSFLDWREQTYPKWMQPSDIYESENLGTNAVHFQANKVLAKMATILKHQDVAVKHTAIAERIKKGINTYLWLPEKKYYGQYLYGRNYKIVSPRSEALGEALCVIFGIADEARAKEIVSHTPLTTFGITCIYPQIPEIPPYHNNAIWPFVQTYWLWAAAKAGNETAVTESIADIYRPAGMFLTNKENMVVDNGDYNGTQVNSSIMLWSISGNISIVQKVLFGIKFEEDRLNFHPFIPKGLKGNRTLNNFKYRDAVLDIAMNGFGNRIVSFIVDGKPTDKHFIAATTKGHHSIKIVLADNELGGTINKVNNYTTIKAPKLQLKDTVLSWTAVENAKSYIVYEDGESTQINNRSQHEFTIATNKFHEYTVVAIDSNGVASFIAEPIGFYNKSQQVEIEQTNPVAKYPYKGYSGAGFVETSTAVNTIVNVPIEVDQYGRYTIDIKYANGNGPINTENKCAIRTLKVDGVRIGALVFPQRGYDEWSNWGFSNAVKVSLTKGKHILTISLEKKNANMNEVTNAAMLDYIRITKL